MVGWLWVIVSTLVLKRLSEASGAGGVLVEGAGESRAGTTKVGVGGTPHPFGACWGFYSPDTGIPGWVCMDGPCRGGRRMAD